MDIKINGRSIESGSPTVGGQTLKQNMFLLDFTIPNIKDFIQEQLFLK